MLNITMRPCQLGSSINTRVERHGDEDVPACDIPLDGIMLTEAELNLLLDDPHASRCLFTAVAGVHQPALPMIAALSLRSKLEGATVELQLSGTSDAPGLMIYGAKLKGIELEPLSGGATKLSLRVQCSGERVPALVGELLAKLNGHIYVDIADAIAVEAKRSKQGELAINDMSA